MKCIWTLGAIAFVVVIGLGGCASYTPIPMADVPFLERAQTKTEDGVTVTVAVLSARESEKIYGRPIAKKGVQPVWIDIRNDTDIPFALIPRSIDPSYFTASEVAYMHRVGNSEVDQQMAKDYRAINHHRLVEPGGSHSGFLLTRLDVGTKVVTVAFFGPRTVRHFVFYVPLPGMKADHHVTDFDALFAEDEIIDIMDEEVLKQTLREFQCCTRNKGDSKDGDPLNIVLIAETDTMFGAMMRSGWDETEALTMSTALKTAQAFFSGKEYRHSPISEQFLFGRPQDVTFQKARDTIHERNHMRLWMTPWTVGGIPIWIGQISRDIGVRMTSGAWNLMTHAIDPEVDEARGYLIADMMAVQSLEALGYIGGVGQATPEDPRTILLGDPYWTDGLRAVMLLTDNPVAIDEVTVVDWDWLSEDDPARAFVTEILDDD